MSQLSSWSEAMEAFDGVLDVGGEIDIAGTTLNPSEVLKEMRPNDYRSYLYDWVDAQGIDGDESDNWDDLDLVP